MTDITLSRELVERAALALENSADMVRTDYETNWRHGIPTRAAQLDSLRRSVEAHESALADLRSALSQPHTERAEAVAWQWRERSPDPDDDNEWSGWRDVRSFDVEHIRRIVAARPDRREIRELYLHPPATPPSPSEEPARCRYCDGTGDVHGPDGEWRGGCDMCPAAATHAFKNFHRSLCARFGYTHDERDWRRDLVSLEEHIAAKTAAPTPAVGGLTEEEMLRVIINACDSLNITRVHELGGPTRTICEDAGLLEIGCAIQSALLAKIGARHG